MKGNFLPDRSKAAFIMSAEELFERNGKLYFWTFTWPDAMPVWCYANSWDRFAHSLIQNYTRDDFEALRVWERHPGGHGIHVHALCNERLDVNLIRELTVRYGLGKVVHVRKAVRKDVSYLTKYMTKDQAIPGLRMWAKMGCWAHVKGSDLEFESKECAEWQTNYRAARAAGGNGGEAFRYAVVRSQMTTKQRAAEWADLSAMIKFPAQPILNGDGTDITTVWADGRVEK